MSTATIPPPEQQAAKQSLAVYRQWIHLAGNEWGSRLMEKVAVQFAADSNIRPLIVTVHEHGGWWLSFVFQERHGQPIICGTANDMASLSEEAEEFGRKYMGARTEYLCTIRREAS